MTLLAWFVVWTILAGVAGAILWIARVLERVARPLEPEWIWWACRVYFGLLAIGAATATVVGAGEGGLRLLGAEDRPEWTLWLVFAVPLALALVVAALAGLGTMGLIQAGLAVVRRKSLHTRLTIARLAAAITLTLAFVALAVITVPATIIFGSAVLMSLGARARSQRVTLLWMLSAATQTRRPLPAELQAWAEASRGKQRGRLELAAEILEQGRPLSDALDLARLLPAYCFPRLHLAEKIGTVPETLADLAREETERLNPVGETASPFVLAAYLSFLPTVSFLIVGFVMYYIIPKFKKIFEDFNTELPSITIGLITVSDNFVNYWYLFSPPLVLICAAAAAVGTLTLYFPWMDFRRRFVDPWIVRLAMTDVMRNLAHQLRCRRPVPEALHDVGHYCINWTVRIRLNHVREMILGGRDLWVELAEARLITRRELAVLQSARQTGHPDWGLVELARRRELAWSQPFAWVMTVLRVMVPLVLGIFVAWICIALFAPLVKLLNDLS